MKQIKLTKLITISRNDTNKQISLNIKKTKMKKLGITIKQLLNTMINY